MKSYKQAIDCYDKSIELDPTDSILYCNKGMVLANLKEYKQALECLNKAIEINSNYYIAYKERGKNNQVFTGNYNFLP
jgi:tetratricopeptide (TPR) repeat protein